MNSEVDELRAAYDAQVRTSSSAHLSPDEELSWDGPLMRVTGGHRGFVGYRDLAGLAGPELDALIERTIEHFDARGQAFEWKWHQHDQPADLADRLRAHGFEPEEPETVLVGLAADLTEVPPLDGVELREVVTESEFRALGRLQSEVWAADWTWLGDELMARRAVEGDRLRVFGAYAPGAEMLSAAWLSLNPGTEFAGLWGGATLAAWRGRGIYRALVGLRAQLAVDSGYRYLQVDASPDSQPILRRLGFVPVATTRPFIHRSATGDQPEPAGEIGHQPG